MNNKYDRELSHQEYIDAGYEMTADGFWVPADPAELAGCVDITIEGSEPAVKLLLLLNGEEIISEVVENLYSDTVKVINPLRVMVQATSSNGNERSSTIAFTDWMPLSQSREIEVNKSFIVSITDPIDTLVESYRNG